MEILTSHIIGVMNRFFLVSDVTNLISERQNGCRERVAILQRWLKVNTKPVRRNMFDGALFPHIIHFTYCVNEQTYTGKRYVNWNKQCPMKGEKITVYYEPDRPDKYAVIVSTPLDKRL